MSIKYYCERCDCWCRVVYSYPDKAVLLECQHEYTREKLAELQTMDDDSD